MIVLDTTVLVYATGSAHPLREPCRTLVAAIARGDLEASTTVEVVQEFVHVRAKRRPRADAVGLGFACADLLTPFLPVGRVELQAGLQLYRDTAQLGAFDAILAAAALAVHADALVSADTAFAAVAELAHVIPDQLSVQRLLRP